MKKKVIIITAVVILVLGIGGTCAGLVWKNSNQEPKQEEQVAEVEENTKTADNKKSEKKEKDKTDSNMSETDVTEISTAGKAIENSLLNNETAENTTDSGISSPVKIIRVNLKIIIVTQHLLEIHHLKEMEIILKMM